MEPYVNDESSVLMLNCWIDKKKDKSIRQGFTRNKGYMMSTFRVGPLIIAFEVHKA